MEKKQRKRTKANQLALTLLEAYLKQDNVKITLQRDPCDGELAFVIKEDDRIELIVSNVDYALEIICGIKSDEKLSAKDWRRSRVYVPY